MRKHKKASLWNNQIFVAEREPLISLVLFWCIQLPQYHSHANSSMQTLSKAVLNVTVAIAKLL